METPQAPESVRATLRKVFALAQTGADGERAAAQQTLDRMLAKYGLVLGDIVDEHRAVVWFKFADWMEAVMLSCVVRVVLGIDDNPVEYVRGNQRKGTRVVGYKLSKVEGVEVQVAYDHYLRLLSAESRIFMRAFINAQGLAMESKGTNNQPTPEEQRQSTRAAYMAQLIEKKSHRKAIQITS